MIIIRIMLTMRREAQWGPIRAGGTAAFPKSSEETCSGMRARMSQVMANSLRSETEEGEHDEGGEEDEMGHALDCIRLAVI
jgi:hypothetical protein